MIKEAIDRVLQLAVPNYHEVAEVEFSDKQLHPIVPPIVDSVRSNTLLGLMELHSHLVGPSDDNCFFHIVDPFTVNIVARESDVYGRRQIFALAAHPKGSVAAFPFGQFLEPENFIIQAQAGFQRSKVEKDDGSFAKDLDYVLSIASKICADQAVQSDDDGIAQRVTVRRGITLKQDETLRGRVTLAPFRTFAEIDQVPSTFVFRARVQNEQPSLALFEADGGRWRLDAVAEISRWLKDKAAKIPIVS